MSFHEELIQRTASSREYLVSAPIIARALGGKITREEYVAFLTQAFHHVRNTVPLLMAAGARLPFRLDWLRGAIVHYLDEELGHDEWILNDIAATGGDAAMSRDSVPAVSTDAMIAYAWDTVMRRNPVGFFGMVFVLEGTSVALALQAADRVQRSLGLPARAMTYLRSHGELDQQHVQHLAGILDRLDDAEDQASVLQCAHAMFRLYGNVFRELDEPHAALAPRRVA